MSVRIEFVLAELTQPEALSIMEMLKCFDRLSIAGQVKSGGFEDVSKDVVALAADPALSIAGDAGATVGSTSSHVAESTEKPRRGRPKKEEVAAAQVGPTPAAANGAASPSAEAEPSAAAAGESLFLTGATAEPSAEAASNATPTIDQLRQALMAYTDKHGMQAGIDMLNKDFGAARITELVNKPVEQQLAFLKKCGHA